MSLRPNLTVRKQFQMAEKLRVRFPIWGHTNDPEGMAMVEGNHPVMQRCSFRSAQVASFATWLDKRAREFLEMPGRLTNNFEGYACQPRLRYIEKTPYGTVAEVDPREPI
jgi:hypothetical protein